MDEDDAFGDVYTDIPSVPVVAQSAPVKQKDDDDDDVKPQAVQLSTEGKEAEAFVAEDPEVTPSNAALIGDGRHAGCAWERTFEAERAALFPEFSGRITESLVLGELIRAREAELSYQESANHAKESQVSLHVAVARLTRENIELRSALALAQQATEPSIVQLRQVMLDPAVNAEMLRLQKELETAKQEAAILLDASRGGRDFTGQIAVLQHKNDKLQRMLDNGAADRTLVNLREKQLKAMQAAYNELEDHTHALDAENNALHMELMRWRKGAGKATVGGDPPLRDQWHQKRGSSPPRGRQMPSRRFRRG